ncbi:MAG: GTPase ObgE [Ignavibacteriales bacterium]|nr:GTPase ObgE [Ignavibacteriales bacterium]
MFVDHAVIEVAAGKGGDGAVAFRREKFVPKGGPAGGDGGDGGSVIFVADPNLHSLLDFRYKRKYQAENGAPGANNRKFGKGGKDTEVKVPVGTLIKDAETGEELFDLDEPFKTATVAQGGKGGRGNAKFATPQNRAPRQFEPGTPGEKRSVELELKLLADVGLVGFPNAGKSTFISKISSARPKIADYPFTTLQPNLGVVKYKEYETFVVADIPGIIEGASEGKGLGLQFLRHIDRSDVLLFMIEAFAEDPLADFRALRDELRSYGESSLDKPFMLAFTKSDAVDEERIETLRKIRAPGVEGEPAVFSSVTGAGVEEVLDRLWATIERERRE